MLSPRCMLQVYADRVARTKYPVPQEQLWKSYPDRVLAYLAKRGASYRLPFSEFSRSDAWLPRVPAPPAGAFFLPATPLQPTPIGPTAPLSGRLSRHAITAPTVHRLAGQSAQPRFSSVFTDLTQLIPIAHPILPTPVVTNRCARRDGWLTLSASRGVSGIR